MLNTINSPTYEALVDAENEHIATMPGFDELSPPLRDAIRRLCISYLHRGATWATMYLMIGGPTKTNQNLVDLSFTLLANAPDSNRKEPSHD